MKLDLDYGENEAETVKEYENCTWVKDLVIDEYSDDGERQDFFLAFLDCVRTPEQASPKHSGEPPTLDFTAPINLCHGLQNQPILPSVKFTKFVDVMGKMVDKLNSHAEMLREEKNLNSMLSNTIEIMKDDIFSKKTKIKKL